MQLLFDNKRDLEAVNAAARDITPQSAARTAPVPLNAGSTQAIDALGSG